MDDEQAIANIAVKLCYEKYPNKSKKFIWQIAPDGLLANIKQERIKLPQRDSDGIYTYLGKKYNIVEVEIDDK